MKKVGLITLYINNFGSLLQAYATRTFLLKNGYDPVSIQKEAGIIEAYEIEANRKKHPEFMEDFQTFMASVSNNNSLVPEESVRQMEAFMRDTLKVVSYSYDELKEAAQSGEFLGFIVGSDQTWNTTAGIVSDFFFLRFAPPHQRIALSPSFGASRVHAYLREDLAEALNEFEMLSAREEEGVAIIKELTGRNALRLSDPTMFLSGQEWREFAGAGDDDESGYLMLHFLDKPNKTAIKNIRHIIDKTHMRVKCFAAFHEEFMDLEGIELAAGGLKDYVKTISNAALVCTDSFHTSILSVNLGVDFYVFDRQYLHGSTQISRIMTLLKTYGLMDRLVLEDALVGIEDLSIHTDAEDIKISERMALSRYLLDALNRL